MPEIKVLACDKCPVRVEIIGGVIGGFRYLHMAVSDSSYLSQYTRGAKSILLCPDCLKAIGMADKQTGEINVQTTAERLYDIIVEIVAETALEG